MTPARAAAVYARVSTSEQVEGTSLQTQLRECRAYVTSQDMTFGGEEAYVDEGVSGSLGSRPALDRLMNAARAGVVGVVVVAKLDRFGRSVVHLSKLLADLDDLGVAFVSLAEHVDGTTPAGRLQRTLLSAFAEFERDRIRERTQDGADAVARDGYWPSGEPPFGLWTVAEGRRRAVVVSEDEAAALRHAVECIVDRGMSTWDTAASMNAMGMRPRKAASWTGHRLRDVLLNASALSGTFVWREGRKGETAIPVPPILTAERHEALRGALALTRRATTYRKHFYLLGARIVSPCGHRMHGYTSDGELGPSAPVYQCKMRWPSVPRDQRCGCQSLRRDIIDTAVWAEVIRLLSDPGALMSGAAEAMEVASAGRGVGSEDLAALDRRIARLERLAGEELAKALRAGVDPVVAQYASSSLHEELGGLREHRRKLVGWLQVNSERAGRAERLWELANRAAQILADPTDETKRAIVEALDIQVTLAGFTDCPACKGERYVPVHYDAARPHGAPRRTACSVCRRTGRTPIWSMTGEVPNELPTSASMPTGHPEPGWPFRVVHGAAGA
ncbi:MAG: recombinase family protein [Acidimicrobiales bacterium]